MKKTVSVISLLLSLLMTFYLFPCDAAAALIGEPDTPEPEAEPEIAEPVEEGGEEVDALFELTDLRTIDTKYLQMSNGTVRALTYGSAVHRKNAEGVFEDIDNRLTEKEDRIDSERVSFMKTLGEDGALFTLSDGEKSVSVSLVGAETGVTAEITNDGKTDGKYETKFEELSTLTKLVSSLRYTGVLPETDLAYTLHGNDLKEDIVINAPGESYAYSFLLSLSGLVPALAEDGSVALYDGEEQIYSFPAPYMYDAEYEYSDAVYYTLEEADGEGAYLLTVTADKEWIDNENRVFPVTVDPTVINMQYRGYLYDSYVLQNGAYSYINHTVIRIGTFNIGYCTGYYSIGGLPSVVDLPLTSAQLCIYCMPVQYNGNGQLTLSFIRTSTYRGDLSQINGQMEIQTEGSKQDIVVSSGDTQISINLLDSYFLTNVARNGEITYCLGMGENYTNYKVTAYSLESDYRPTLILGYGYSVSSAILSTNTASPESHYALTNEREQMEPGCTMLVPGTGMSPIHMNYDPTYSQRKICILSASSTAQTVKICYYESGKYLSTVSATAGSPVVADTSGDWDSWTLIWLNDGTMIIQSVTCSGMVLTRTQQSVCVDYLSEAQIGNQIWRLAGTGDTGRTIDTGIYYINSNNTKKFLVNNTSGSTPSLTVSSATVGEYGDRMAWAVSYIGNGKYTLQSVFDTEKFLYVNASGVGLVSYTGAPESKSLFTFTQEGDYYTIKSSAGYFLASTSLTPLCYSAVSNDVVVWRFYKRNDYHEIANFNFNCSSEYTLPEGSSANYGLTIGGTMSYNIGNKQPSNATWTTNADFLVSTDSTLISINTSTKKVSALSKGIATITVLHIPTNTIKTITVKVYKKAIIILPGIMGSRIFADGQITIDNGTIFNDGAKLWDPPVTNLVEIINASNCVLALACNEYGQPKYSTKVNQPLINHNPQSTDVDLYGALDMYESVYSIMYNAFSQEYDIVLYEYDWRFDPYDTALDLDDFIDEHYYGNIVFISHSMGGIVSSYFLSLGDEQRWLVDKHISVGTPYLGCEETPYDYITGAFFEHFYQNLVLSDAIASIAYNIPSVYSLFPFEQKWRIYFSYRLSPDITPNCTTYAETIGKYRQMMPNWNCNLEISTASNRVRLFDIEGAYITNYVDSYYIVGEGLETAKKACGIPDSLFNPTHFATITLQKDLNGDQTVTKYSATIGFSVPYERIYYKTNSSTKDASHKGMIDGGEEEDYSTIFFIQSIIDNTVGAYSANELQNFFGIHQVIDD